MAKLRGGSTVGGRQIASIDMLNDVVYQITDIELASKLNKFESNTIDDFVKTDSYINKKDKNGFWQVQNATNSPDILNNNNGLLANLSNDNARFQLYSSNDNLFFRTGWNDSIGNWNKVVTDNILQDSLNTKFNNTGGNLTGNIEATNYISTNSFLRTKNDDDSLKISINSDNEAFYEASTDISRHNFNKPINATNISINDNLVYHAGLFDYNSLAKKNAQGATQTNLNNITESGIYYGKFTSNSPVSNDVLSYLDVSANDSGTNIIQKLFASNGVAYFRTYNLNTWTSWFTMGGTLKFSKQIQESNWINANGIYELSLTHNLGSNNITSVVVTDSDQISMFTGFKILSTSTIKIFSSTAVAGKVVITANQ